MYKLFKRLKTTWGAGTKTVLAILDIDTFDETYLVKDTYQKFKGKLFTKWRLVERKNFSMPTNLTALLDHIVSGLDVSKFREAVTAESQKGYDTVLDYLQTAEISAEDKAVGLEDINKQLEYVRNVYGALSTADMRATRLERTALGYSVVASIDVDTLTKDIYLAKKHPDGLTLLKIIYFKQNKGTALVPAVHETIRLTTEELVEVVQHRGGN